MSEQVVPFISGQIVTVSGLVGIRDVGIQMVYPFGVYMGHLNLK